MISNLCVDENHHTIKVIIKGFDGKRFPVCKICNKQIDRSDSKWENVCDRCFCAPGAHGKNIYSICNQCKSCGFYIGVFNEG